MWDLRIKKKKLRLEVEYLKVEWELVSTDRDKISSSPYDFKEYFR